MFRRFRREARKSLVEIPGVGEPLEFDEEEQRGIRAAFPNLEAIMVDEQAADSMNRQFTAQGLRKVAARRFDRGDFSDAASTCVKALAVMPGDWEAWLVLGQTHAATGDLDRAERLLAEAERAAKRAGINRDSPLWRLRADALREQIKR